MKTIIHKLSDVQSRLKAPKGQFNSFGKYKYRSCEDIVESLKPLLTEHGLALVMSDTMVETGGRVYVHATAVVSDGEGERFLPQALLEKKKTRAWMARK